MLTVKSDDIVGRLKTYEAIVKGESIPNPGIPESFRVLTKELQSLGLDLQMYSNDKKIELAESFDDEENNSNIDTSLEDDLTVTENDFAGMSVEEDGELVDDQIESDDDATDYVE